MKRSSISAGIINHNAGVLSCEKYEEGGSLGNADKTIATNNVDITEDFTAELWEFSEDQATY